MLIDDDDDDDSKFKLFVTQLAEWNYSLDAMNRKGREGHKKTAVEILWMQRTQLLSTEEELIAKLQMPTVMESSIYDTVEATIKC